MFQKEQYFEELREILQLSCILLKQVAGQPKFALSYNASAIIDSCVEEGMPFEAVNTALSLLSTTRYPQPKTLNMLYTILLVCYSFSDYRYILMVVVEILKFLPQLFTKLKKYFGIHIITSQEVYSKLWTCQILQFNRGEVKGNTLYFQS